MEGIIFFGVGSINDSNISNDTCGVYCKANEEQPI